MRLIDADALPIVTECCVDEAGFFAKFNVVHEEDIRNAPTIEAESVVRGRWVSVYDGKWYKCSECECHWERGLVDECNVNYCPNCGAKMDGENNAQE